MKIRFVPKKSGFYIYQYKDNKDTHIGALNIKQYFYNWYYSDVMDEQHIQQSLKYKDYKDKFNYFERVQAELKEITEFAQAFYDKDIDFLEPVLKVNLQDYEFEYLRLLIKITESKITQTILKKHLPTFEKNNVAYETKYLYELSQLLEQHKDLQF